jgi:glycosyltransferase involved in cell wall biosynthesis
MVVPPDSASKLAEAIIWAYRNQEKWRKMGEAGRVHANKYYSRRTITDRYDKLLRKMRDCH